jgi:LuxR family maltose regulon positive regulatory protein
MAANDLPTNPVLLLQTKLHKPPVSPQLIRRTRLEKRLDQGLDRKLILVSAPAGYGKTTLVVQWLDACDSTAAWLSLQKGDGDLVTFLRYLIAAIHTLFPDVCSTTWAMLEAQYLPPMEHLATHLSNELNQIPQKFLLVLDDYHEVQTRSVHKFVETFLQFKPRSMCLVLITRADPALPLPTLRAKRDMLELRSDDLRFTQDEVWSFFEQTMKLEIDAESLANLEQHTEGWVAGLRLAALSLRNAGELPILARNLKGSNRHVMDYLLTEVISSQRPAIQELLLYSSILQRFCAPLLNTLLVHDENVHKTEFDGGIQEMLEWMEQTGLFLVPLDNERIWYQYHRMFQALLEHKLITEWSEETIASLHSRASDRFAVEGLVEEALHHALAAGDAVQAARPVEKHRHALMNQEDWRTLVRWLEMLPQELVNQRPALLLIRAWQQLWLWQYATMFPLLQDAAVLIEHDPQGIDFSEKQILRGEIEVLYSALGFAHGDGQLCLESAQRALERIPPTLIFVRGLLLAYLAWGYQMTGQAEAGVRILEEILSSAGP